MLFVYDFNLQVGEKEKHNISFHYSKWLGAVSVKSDGIEVARTRIVVNPQAPMINVTVGDKEKHNLRFDIHPNWLFFIKPTVQVYVDDKLVYTY